MSLFQSLIADGADSDVIWTIGDSISRGNSDAVGATPDPNTVYQWDAGSANLRMITNLDLLEPVAAGAIGSQWPAAGSRYWNELKRKPIFVNCGIGGSAFFNPTAGFSWWTNDTLFATALTKLNNCLAYVGKSAPKLVWINCGINDVVQGNALDQVYLTSLIDRILAEFPAVRICMTQPWSSTVTTYANLTRLFQIRKWIKALCFTYSSVEIAGDLGLNTSWGSNFQADNIHLNALGNGFYGDKTMRGICRSLSLNKWTRSWIGVLYAGIPAQRITWMDTLVSALDSAGELQNIDSFQVSSTGGYTDATNKWKNSIQDLGFLSVNTYPIATPDVDFDGWTAAGLVDNDRISTSPLTLLSDKANLSNDFICGVWMGANGVVATTSAAQFGVRESAAGGIVLLRQNGANQIEIYGGGVTGTVDGTETRPANAFYAAARNAGNQILVRQDVEVATGAVAAVAFSPGANVRSLSTGNYNNNGTIQLRWAGLVKARIYAKYTTMNKTTVVNAVDSFLSDWLTAAP